MEREILLVGTISVSFCDINIMLRISESKCMEFDYIVVFSNKSAFTGISAKKESNPPIKIEYFRVTETVFLRSIFNQLVKVSADKM